MKKDSKKDSAVSPVIGTILLVAITVVLVAIISAVVMGMTGNVGQTYVVGVKVTANSGTVEGHDVSLVNVSFTGGDYAKITSFHVTKDGERMNYVGGTTTTEYEGEISIGKIYSFSITGKEMGEVNVVAKFNDGKEQSIYTQKLGF